MAFLKKAIAAARARGVLAVGLALAAGLAATEPTLAQADGAMELLSTGGKAIVVAIASIVIIFASVFATLFAALIGELMGSTFILDTGMGEVLKLVWVVMRNLVNIALTLGLLVLAVPVVLNIGGSEQSGIALLKKILPKFIIALIAVNFTFFGARLVLSANDILATAVFSLPQAVWQGNIRGLPCPTTASAENGAFNTPDCVTEIQKELEAATKNVEVEWEKSSGETVTIKKPNDSATGSSYKEIGGFIQKMYSETDQLAVSVVNRENFALAMLSNMLDMKTIINLNATNNSFFGTLVSTVGAAIATLITTFVFFFLLVALVVRMVMLWVLIAVAPLGLAAKILGDTVSIPFLSEVDWVKNFMRYAFYPLLASVPLSVGMVMIFAGNSLTSLGTTSSDAITAALAGDMHALLWWAAAIGVIWVGTKKAIDQAAPLAGGIVDSVYGGVNALGKGALGSVKYAPIVPLPGGQSISLDALQAVPEQVRGNLRGLTQKKAKSISGPLSNFIRDGSAPTDLSEEDANTALLSREVKTSEQILAALKEDANRAGSDGNHKMGEQVAAKWFSDLDTKAKDTLAGYADIKTADHLAKANRKDIAEALRRAGIEGAEEVLNLYAASSADKDKKNGSGGEAAGGGSASSGGTSNGSGGTSGGTSTAHAGIDAGIQDLEGLAKGLENGTKNLDDAIEQYNRIVQQLGK